MTSLFLVQFLILFIFYSFARFVFLVWNWGLFQSQSTSDLILAFFYGLRFDLVALSFLCAIPFLVAVAMDLVRIKPSKQIKAVFSGFHWLLNVPLLFLNFVDVEFVNCLGRRYTYDALFFVREVPGKFTNLILYYWPMSVVTFGSLGLLLYVLLKVQPLTNPFWQSRKRVLSVAFGVFCLLVIASRGGLQSKPLTFTQAQIFSQPMMNQLVLNSSFTFLKTLEKQALPRDQFFSNPQDMLKHLNGSKGTASILEGVRPSAKPNVVVIVIESFALEYMGYPFPGSEGYTPFLDSLAKDSLFFPFAFANARRSIEGIGAIYAGVPALMNEPFISSQYVTNGFFGLGTLLKPLGYHTSFFHGAKNGSMYFDSFMQSAGVDHYYGQNEFPNPEKTDGTWGIWDEDMLLFMADQLKTFPQPFFSGVFTLTSHNPFKIPEQYKDKFPKGVLEIHESVGYTDHALKMFFEKIQHESWFQNTLFVITADHTYKSSRPGFGNFLGTYRVPLFFYYPGMKWPGADFSEPVQHIDILPSILDFVGEKPPTSNYLSRSVFQPGPRTVVDMSDNRYLLISKDYFLTWVRGMPGEMYSVQDPDQKTPLLEPASEKEKLEQTLKATIQYFSQGMWDQKLYYPAGSHSGGTP